MHNGIRSTVLTTIRRTIRAIRYFGNERYCPICEHNLKTFLPAGNPVREDVRCPVCGSLERHRLIWRYFSNRTQLLSANEKTLLHFAPENCIQRRLISYNQIHYLSCDLESELVQFHTDIVRIALSDESIDIGYASHVLEHVQDDERGLQEIYRILRSGGCAVFQVPIDLDRETTYEDFSVTDPKEREIHFGQSDHVRIYGRDFQTRLERAGFQVRADAFASQISTEETLKIRIDPSELIYVCIKPNDTSTKS